jgi:hypothetical protein
MRSTMIRLALSVAFLAAAFWMPRPSIAFETCPPSSCSAMRDACENRGGQFSQTSISVCNHNGINQPSFEGLCSEANHTFTGDACWGV